MEQDQKAEEKDETLEKFMKYAEEAAKAHVPIGSTVQMSDRKYVVRWDGAWVRVKE